MSSFLTPLIVSPLEDGRLWELMYPFEYHVGTLQSKDVIEVPAGFITDFASIPQFLWFWLPYWGKYGKAAVVHDYLYQVRTRSRKESDQIFKEAMLVAHTSPKKALLIYLAVRIFGWLPWKLSKGEKK